MSRSMHWTSLRTFTSSPLRRISSHSPSHPLPSSSTSEPFADLLLFFSPHQLSRTKSNSSDQNGSKPKSPSPTPPIVPSSVPATNGNKPVPPLPSNGTVSASNPISTSSPAVPSPAAASLSSLVAGGGASSSRAQPPTTPERKSSAPTNDKTSPAPPVVVVSSSSDMAVDAAGAGAGGAGGIPGGGPPSGSLGRLRGGAKDTIPIAGKTPRKQRSSRFHVTERVELEKLPGFNG